MSSEKNSFEDMKLLNDFNKENISIKSLLDSIPLNNLNDYYDIETSIFKKKCEKLNLKFYLETESLQFQKDIPSPYNKLLIILFQEIYLYIEEIERLNKQLREKDKNIQLTHIQDKLKENNFGNLKNINEKVKNENEKIQQNVNINNTINISNSIVHPSILNNSDNMKYFINVNTKTNKNLYENNNEKKNKKNCSNSIKEFSSQSVNNEMNSDLIERCINQYDDELYNLQELEDFLMNQKKQIIRKNSHKNCKNNIKHF